MLVTRSFSSSATVIQIKCCKKAIIKQMARDLLNGWGEYTKKNKTNAEKVQKSYQLHLLNMKCACFTQLRGAADCKEACWQGLAISP